MDAFRLAAENDEEIKHGVGKMFLFIIIPINVIIVSHLMYEKSGYH